MSLLDAFDILEEKYIKGSVLVKKYRKDLAALRDENKKLKEAIESIRLAINLPGYYYTIKDILRNIEKENK